MSHSYVLHYFLPPTPKEMFLLQTSYSYASILGDINVFVALKFEVLRSSHFQGTGERPPALCSGCRGH